MIISLISALSINRKIGMKNSIPWNLSADLAWFKKNTLRKSIIMGRKTFESIGKPLPNRHNIVLSRKSGNSDSIVTWVTTPIQALSMAKNSEEVMIIGGEKIYNIFFSQARRLYLTHINIDVDGDTVFPNYKLHEWKSTFNEYHDPDNKNKYSYYFEILDRI